MKNNGITKYITIIFGFVILWIMMIISSVLMPALSLFGIEVKMKLTKK